MARRGRKPAPLVAPINADDYLVRNQLIRQAEVARQDAAAEVSTAKKRAKAAGLDMAAYGLLTKLRKMAPDAAVNLLQTALRYARWEQQPFATQGGLFTDAKDNDRPSEDAQQKQALFDAEQSGRHVGASGNSATLNPHEAGTELHVAWVRGWQNGKEFYDRSKPAGETAASAGGRGRPKKSDAAPPAPTHEAPATAQ